MPESTWGAPLGRVGVVKIGKVIVLYTTRLGWQHVLVTLSQKLKNET